MEQSSFNVTPWHLTRRICKKVLVGGTRAHNVVVCFLCPPASNLGLSHCKGRYNTGMPTDFFACKAKGSAQRTREEVFDLLP